MRLVVALGGNALLRRNQAQTAANQLANVRIAAEQLARIALVHCLVVTHGNGPQVGLLALQAEAYKAVSPYPLDVLGAQTEGMIGYLLEQELSNRLPPDRTVTTLLSRVEVDGKDTAFAHPTKPIGPVYSAAEAKQAAAEHGWQMAADGEHMRRVVPSPRPVRMLGLEPIRWLLDKGALVIAAGGGGIPVVRDTDVDAWRGVEAVIDKDLCASLLAQGVHADVLIIVTDVAGVYLDWNLPTQRLVRKVTPEALAGHNFAAGSMGPKVEAACDFVRQTGRRAAIGSLEQIGDLLSGHAGTQICTAGEGGLETLP